MLCLWVLMSTQKHSKVLFYWNTFVFIPFRFLFHAVNEDSIMQDRGITNSRLISLLQSSVDYIYWKLENCNHKNPFQIKTHDMVCFLSLIFHVRFIIESVLLQASETIRITLVWGWTSKHWLNRCTFSRVFSKVYSVDEMRNANYNNIWSMKFVKKIVKTKPFIYSHDTA